MSKLIRKVVKKYDRPFFYCLHILSVKKRRAMYAVYAFDKHINDIASSNETKIKKLELLDAWKKEIDTVYNNSMPVSQTGKDIFASFQNFNLPKEDFEIAINEIRNDIVSPRQQFSLADYEKCCDDKSGSFVRQTLRVLGCQDENIIKKLASCLGKALQTTIFLRDIKDNALKGKIYIPQNFLQEAGIFSNDPMEIVRDNNLGKARCKLGQIARANYNEAFAVMKNLDKKMAQRLKVFFYPYKYCFDAMENRGWEVLTPKPDITPLTRLALAVKAYMEG